MNLAELDDIGASEALPRVLVVDDDPLNLDRPILIGDLHQAITGGQLALHYQPQVETATGRLTVLGLRLAGAMSARDASPICLAAAMSRLSYNTGPTRAHEAESAGLRSTCNSPKGR